MLPKNKAWRSRHYLDWVASQPCCVCGAPADEAHHIKGTGGMSGTGMKAPDSASMPMCRTHHDEMHRDPSLWPDQYRYITATLIRAIDQGVFKL